MTDESGAAFKPWMKQVGAYIDRQLRNGAAFSPIDLELIRLYQLSDGISAVVSCWPPVGRAPVLGGMVHVSPTESPNHLHSALYKWAKLQHR
jgi:hypothetical protein